MRFSAKLVGNYPPVYDINYVPPEHSTLYKVVRYVAFILLMTTIGLVFPTQITSILDKIPYFSKD